MNAAIADPEADIWNRTLNPEAGNLPAEAARALLQIQFTTEDHRQMNELAEKARQGTLAAEEGRLLESYRHVAWLLGLLKSKARLSLKLAGGVS